MMHWLPLIKHSMQRCNVLTRLLLSTTVLVMVLTFTVPVAQAQGTNLGGPSNGSSLGGPTQGSNLGGSDCGGGSGALQNPLKNICSLPDLLYAILDAVTEIGAIILIVMLVWVGFLFVVAQGRPEEISKARSALIWTLIGGMILLGARAIAEVIQATVTKL